MASAAGFRPVIRSWPSSRMMPAKACSTMVAVRSFSASVCREQAGVFDRDGRLIGQGTDHQPFFRRIGQFGQFCPQAQNADQLVANQQRHEELSMQCRQIRTFSFPQPLEIRTRIDLVLSRLVWCSDNQITIG